MNTLEFFWGGGGDESPRWGHSPRMRSRGSGDEGSLPNSFEWEFILFIKTYFYGGALTSHFMEEHSSPTSIFPVFMMTSSNGNMFRATGFFCGEFTGDWWPMNSPHTDQWRGAFIFSLNKRLRKQLRRRWFETPSRSLWRHCNVVPNSDPVIRAAVKSFGVQRITLVQFWIGETGQIGGGGGGGGGGVWGEWHQFWHTVLPWLPFLEINYIFCTQRQFKFVVSDHP